MDFDMQFGTAASELQITSTDDYKTLCAEAGIEPITTGRQLRQREYCWSNARYTAAEWENLGQERRCEQVIGQVYLRYLNERAAAKRTTKQAPQMVLCDCGHHVQTGQQMSTANGSACFNCYDRMSDK